MKYTRLIGFEKHLQNAAPLNFSQLYLVISKHPGERKFAVDKLTSHLVQALGGTLKVFQSDTKAQEIFNELETLSFLQSKKIILVHDAELLEKVVLEKLENYFMRPSPGFFLVLCFSEIKSKSSFYKSAEKHGIILELLEEKPWEKEKTLQELLLQEAQFQGKKMSPELAQALVRGCPPDINLLLSELTKLICYIGERQEITRQDLLAIVTLSSQESGWQLSEAIHKRNVPLALKIVRGMLAQDVHFFALIRLVRQQFQTTFQVSSQASLNDFPQMKETTFERHFQFAQNYGIARLPDALKTIDAVELMAKNGMDQYDFLADLLIFKLTQIT